MAAALDAAGYVMDQAGNTLGRWHGLSGHGRHSLTLGTPGSNDVILYQEQISKGVSASHTFSYNCSRGEEITAVLAYDIWSDGTGGNPKRKSGGVGQDEVSIHVTGQLFRGFHFKFIVYGNQQS